MKKLSSEVQFQLLIMLLKSIGVLFYYLFTSLCVIVFLIPSDCFPYTFPNGLPNALTKWWPWSFISLALTLWIWIFPKFCSTISNRLCPILKIYMTYKIYCRLFPMDLCLIFLVDVFQASYQVHNTDILATWYLRIVTLLVLTLSQIHIDLHEIQVT